IPTAPPKSLITGERVDIQWSGNWDDDLGGTYLHKDRDPMLKGIEDKVQFEFDQTFMFYLPRICEHCLNPTCVASCPSGAIPTRQANASGLDDQDGCGGSRKGSAGCALKPFYFNHLAGKAERCPRCASRLGQGEPTARAQPCVRRLRYDGLVLSVAHKVTEA